MRRKEYDMLCETFFCAGGKDDIYRLFSDDFLREYSRFATFGEMAKALGIKVAGVDEVVSQMEQLADEDIYLNTEFACWDEMWDTLSAYYLVHNSGS